MQASLSNELLGSKGLSVLLLYLIKALPQGHRQDAVSYSPQTLLLLEGTVAFRKGVTPRLPLKQPGLRVAQ